MKKIICILIILFGFSSNAQQIKQKTIVVATDTIRLDSLSISPYNFKVLDSLKQEIDTSFYAVNYAKSQLVIKRPEITKIIVEYRPLPDFLTKTYAVFDKSLIVPGVTDVSRLYSVKGDNRKTKNFIPFDGLNTQGSISRGLTMGNNQDAVVNSNLDLQLSGNLSKDVRLRASITDTNIPLQENGFTQRLDEFDRVFIEIIGKNWNVKAGDVNFVNTHDQFLRFNKKVAGVMVEAMTEGENFSTRFFASGALVRGQFARNVFLGQEGNQGPYKITGTNTEQFLILISGSETVYVNGVPLQRGENNDYIIDYNTAEITFMPTYPVTANMRITVEYQYADRKYTRFVTYNGAEYQNDKLRLGLKFYNENDIKNQSFQQDLTNAQREILAQAGDNNSQMIVPSAYVDAYEENKILYRKDIIGQEEVFVFSNNPEDELFRVQFTYVGENQGNYRIQSTIASGRVFEYIAPIDGQAQGAYEPVVQLVAPNKIQLAVFTADFNPDRKTSFSSELAFSNNDINLFSSIDDRDNKGFAGKLKWNQVLIDRDWDLKSGINYEFISSNFKTIERFRNVEFNRDWDLINASGEQHFLSTFITLDNTEKGNVSYRFDRLSYSDNFKGSRHNLISNLNFKNTKFNILGSYLINDSDQNTSHFFRWTSALIHSFKKSWVGAKFNSENNERKDKATDIISPVSHRFSEYETYFGVGDTTKIYAEIGYNYRATDSVTLNRLTPVNLSNTLYLRSRLLKKKTADLSLFLNYRNVENVSFNDEESFNTRAVYRQQLLKNAINFQTVYETNSGSLPQQEYSYIEVDTGLGYYTWNDYNNNNIQELDEFEVAQFQDEANYVRVLLPTINFIRTHQNKFSHSLTLNASQWANRKGFKKVLSHFVNQSFLLIDNKHLQKSSGFNFNPFAVDDDVLALQMNVKNSLFFNRGKQHYSTTYTILKNRTKNSFAIADYENILLSHQLLFSHKIGKFWLVDLKGVLAENKSASENFLNRNYTLESNEFNPKLSYLYNANSRFETYYHLKNKENKIGDLEHLSTHNFGVNFLYAKEKQFSLNASVNLVLHKFKGNSNSAVAYQMLEGLQAGTNYTWNFSLQKRITSYLDINFNYSGRKSEAIRTIHTGNLQLRASF